MSRTTPYADLVKIPNDLIGKGFPGEGFKVTTEAKIPAGVALKTAMEKGPKGVKLTVENTDYKWVVGGANCALKAKWASDQLFEASVAVTDLVTPGTEIKPWYNQSFDSDTKSLVRKQGLVFGFVNDRVNFSFKPEIESVTRVPQNFEAALVIQGPQNLFWGAKVKHNPPKEAEESDSAWDVDVRLHYVLPDTSFTVALEPDAKAKGRHPPSQLSFTWFQSLSDNLKVATSFLIPPGSASPTGTIACENKWDSTTVKSKLTISGDKENRVAFAYTRNVSTHAVASFGADLNANKLVGADSKDTKDHNFGFELQLK